MLKKVIKECHEYITLLQTFEKGYLLTRDVNSFEIDIQYNTLSTAKRKPRKMPQNVHDKLNVHFNNIFGWNVRNGLFSFGVKSNYGKLNDNGYGKTYLLFPKGEFSFVYDIEIFDLYGYFEDYPDVLNNVNQFIESINYVESNLKEVFNKNIVDGRSSEIMINAPEYYLVNTKYADQLIKEIWG